MTKENIFIALPPQQLPLLQGWDVTPAHLAYRIGKGSRLLRAGCSSPPKGGLMVVDDQDFDGSGPVAHFCQEMIQECQVRNFSGAVLDFEKRSPPLEQTAARLDDLFSRRGFSLFVPEGYGSCAPQAKVMISSALSGGSLSFRLEECMERFGRDRVVLALEKVAEDFILPSPSGKGTPLTQTDLREKINCIHPAVFFSPELCARYFTYMGHESGAHFVLFDDGDTLRRKMEVARQLGINTFFAPWAEISDCAERMGLPRSADRKKNR